MQHRSEGRGLSGIPERSAERRRALADLQQSQRVDGGVMGAIGSPLMETGELLAAGMEKKVGAKPVYRATKVTQSVQNKPVQGPPPPPR